MNRFEAEIDMQIILNERIKIIEINDPMFNFTDKLIKQRGETINTFLECNLLSCFVKEFSCHQNTLFIEFLKG